MRDPNPKLSKNILAEVLIEIRFNPVNDLSLVVGKLNSKLQNYPIFENLNIPEFPVSNPELNNIIRYRFYSQDRKKLYNLGKGILTINTVEYDGYENFLEDINAVFKEHIEISQVQELTRVGLRYINRIDAEKYSTSDIFKINISLPKYLNDIEKGFGFTFNGKIDEDSLHTRLYTGEEYSKSIYMLDFDYFTNQTINYQLDALSTWVDKAHTCIYKSFKESLTHDYFQTLV